MEAVLCSISRQSQPLQKSSGLQSEISAEQTTEFRQEDSAKFIVTHKSKVSAILFSK